MQKSENKETEKSRRIKKVMAVFAVLLAAGTAYGLITGWLGFGIPCPFHSITGFKCPGCGVSRMFISILRLDFKEAFNSNRLLFVTLPVIICLLGIDVFRYISLKPRRHTKIENTVYVILIVLFLVFAVLRNLPWLDW